MSASNAIGLFCAFGSALVFVSSNIFFKKIMPTNSSQSAHKLDKLNLLLYSSGMAFLLMIPVWVYYDLPVFLSPQVDSENVSDTSADAASHSVVYYFFMNGTVHFAQNIIAFIILSSTSPVTYSIASLIKRVAVICIAIVWFKQVIHPVQGFGIVMTFVGLYMYNNAKGDVEQGENKMRRVEAVKDMILPTTKAESRMLGVETPPEYDYPQRVGMTVSHHQHHRQYASNVSKVNARSIQLHPPSIASQVSNPPNLTIKVPLHAQNVNFKQNPAASPVDSYPSPPPSLDSPPMKTVSLEPSPGFQEQLMPALSRLEQYS